MIRAGYAPPPRQPAGASGDPPAARGVVLLDQAALGPCERPRRPAIVMPVGVLATLPGQQPHIAGVGPVQGQIPVHIRIPDARSTHRPQRAATPEVIVRS
jgi:hypothetical protein